MTTERRGPARRGGGTTEATGTRCGVGAGASIKALPWVRQIAILANGASIARRGKRKQCRVSGPTRGRFRRERGLALRTARQGNALALTVHKPALLALFQPALPAAGKTSLLGI